MRSIALHRKQLLTILLILFLCIITRLVLRTGFVNLADDHEYCKTAFEIYSGNLPIPTNHWMLRIGHNFSIALSYLLFGINEYSIFVPPILFSFLNILLIFALSREILKKDCSPMVNITSAILFIFLPLSIYSGSTAHYDQGLTFFMFLSVYFYLIAQKTDRAFYYLFCGLSIGISFLGLLGVDKNIWARTPR